MKRVYCMVLALAFIFSLSHANFVFAEGEAANDPAKEVPPAVVQAPVVPAVPAEAVKADDEMADTEELDMEEESEDVKILREAAAKLKATDPALATKLEQLAEDFSW